LERITITVDDELLALIDGIVQRRGYPNRSKAIRNLLREAARAEAVEAEAASCYATLSYVYNHHQRDLGERVTATQHADHHLTIATTHVHLDHDNCLEVAVLRGDAGDVQRLADRVTTERGVRHAALHLIPDPKA